MSSSSSSDRRPDEPIPLALLSAWPRGLPPRLPAPLTSLIGREAEVARVAALVRDPAVRLVTLTGPGGVGKTRLALQVATEIGDEFADGVAFVELAAVRDPALVVPTIAQTLGIRPISHLPAIDALKTALRDQVVLLLLDNFEQVTAAAPAVTELLAACPRLKVLVTSRARLHVSGEHVFAVPPLPVPAGSGRWTVSTVAAADATRLFVERAAAVRSTFRLTEENAAPVAEICQRLDGLPLAIELAAARCAFFAPTELLARLEPRLPQLTGGPRDHPARLQTMRDAIAWSHELLSPEEQTVFRCLSIFAGGCTLEAAEAVCGGQESGVRGRGKNETPSPAPRLLTPDSSVVDVVDSLTRQSLVQVVESPDGAAGEGTTRLVMLETIREFALERLAASGEEVVVRRRHAAWCLELTERYELADLLPDGDRVLAVLEAEHANLRAALAWLDESGEPGLFLQLAAALGRFWAGQAPYDEGRGWLERALAQDGAAPADRAKALVHLGVIEVYQGRFREAEPRLAEGLAGCRDQGHALHAVLALHVLGALASLQGDHDRGAALVEESLAAARAVADPRLSGIMMGWGLTNLAFVARSRGDHALATEHLEEALRRMRDAGYVVGTILALGDLGDLARDEGDHERALGLYREALALGREHPGMRVVTDVVEAVGIVAVALGQAERGARLLAAAEVQRERTGLRFRVAENQLALEQAVATSRASLGDEAFATAWAAGRILSPDQAVGEAADVGGAQASQTPSLGLTPREAEILRLLATGLTDPAIAAALFISVRTVEHHVGHIFDKLGVRTRTAAASAAIAAGLVDPASSLPA